MPRYQYRATDHQGLIQQGEIFATVQSEIQAKLQQKELWLLDVEELTSQKANHKRVKISRRELIDLFTAFSTMLKAGVPLIESISSIAQHTSNAGLKHTLNMVHNSIENGVSLADAMAEHPAVFPIQITSIVHAGEQSGQLPATFVELRSYYEWLASLIGDIKQASTYPIIVFVVVCLFILTLFTFVVPRFTEMLNGLGVALPMITVLVIDISQFAIQYWWALLAIPTTIFMGAHILYKKSTIFANHWDTLKLNIPIFGAINQMIALSRFTHHFSIMFRSGIPILDCLKHCRQLVGNAKLASIIKETEQSVSEGNHMSDTLSKHQAFPPMLLQMIKVGESTGDLDYAMAQVATYYDEEIPRSVKRVFAVMEPLIMLILIGIVGTVAIAIFLPIISLLGGI